MNDPYKEMYNGKNEEEQKNEGIIPIENPRERIKKKIKKAVLPVILIASLITGGVYCWKQYQVHKKQEALANMSEKFEVVKDSYSVVSNQLATKNQQLEKTQIALKTKEKRLGELEKMMKELQHNQALMLKANKSYDPTKVYFSWFNTPTLEGTVLETAAVNKSLPVKSLFKEDFNEAYAEYNLSYCGSRYVLNEGFKDILGGKWSKYEQDFVEGKLDVDMHGRSMKLVNWIRFDDNWATKGEINLNKNELKEVKQMIDKYR
jgi:hypothetical protein